MSFFWFSSGFCQCQFLPCGRQLGCQHHSTLGAHSPATIYSGDVWKCPNWHISNPSVVGQLSRLAQMYSYLPFHLPTPGLRPLATRCFHPISKTFAFILGAQRINLKMWFKGTKNQNMCGTCANRWSGLPFMPIIRVTWRSGGWFCTIRVRPHLGKPRKPPYVGFKGRRTPWGRGTVTAHTGANIPLVLFRPIVPGWFLSLENKLGIVNGDHPPIYWMANKTRWGKKAPTRYM